VHGYKATVTAALARRWIDCPVVKTEHGRVEPACGRPLVWLKHALNGGLDRWATRRAADCICYVTEDIRRHCANAHQDLARITIHNGIEPLDRHGYPRPENLVPGYVHLGIVGRVSAVKGVDTVLAAAAAADWPFAAIVHVIGTGPLVGLFARKAAACGLDEKVQFHGFRRDVLAWIANLDALLMPSLHEGLPYTLLEAMSLGTPVLAAQVGGLAEVLRDGETGLLFPPRDPDRLCATVRAAVAAPGLLRALGCAAQEEQRAHFTLARMGDAYRQVYAEVAAGRSPRG
jgi:glycosyltransferase involved in cell wall biosynthesis